jgi:integrase
MLSGTTLPTQQRQRTHIPTIQRIRVNGKFRWKVSGLYVNRKRVRRLFSSRESADQFLADETQRKQNLGARAAAVPGALFEDALRAADILIPFGASLETAARAFADSAARRAASVTVRDLKGEFLATNGGLRAWGPRHRADLDARLERFARDCGDTLVSEITTQSINDWLLSLHKPGKSSRPLSLVSVSNFRRALGNCFAYAKKRGYTAENPVEASDKPRVKNIAEGGIYTPAELRAILRAAHPSILPALAIGAFAGFRSAEIARLTWEDVLWDRGHIRLPASKSKTASYRLVPIQPNLAAFLAPYANAIGEIIPDSGRQYYILRERAHRAAGFGKPGEETEEERAAGVTLRPAPDNGLRHSFASYRLAATNDAARTSLELGHKTTTLLFSTYRELVTPKDAADYWNIFPEVADGKNNVVPFVAEATDTAA